MASNPATTLNAMYDALRAAYGAQHWWPGESPLEVAVGAILTQNTNWSNVARAIIRLRASDCLNWAALRDVPIETLAELIRPAGYYNVKARRLKHFVDWVWRACAGDWDALRRRPLDELRAELLAINGIGPETADSILLYALERPTFVIDAYTARVVKRHRLIDVDADYEQMKELFENALPAETPRYNEFHALIVAVGKGHCRPTARCAGCPLESFEHEDVSARAEPAD